MAVLALPTYISISEAAERYQLGREALTHLVEAGKLRAVKIDGNFAVAKEDMRDACASDLSIYISISEASKRYQLGREALTHLVETGRVRAVEIGGDIAVAEDDMRDACTSDLPTYISISEASKRYQLGREALTYLVETGKVRAVEIGGDIAVAEDDMRDACTSDLPTYISISEASKRYQLGREALTHLVETGKVRAVKIDGDIAVAEEDIDAVRVSDLPTYVSISEAAKRYQLSREVVTHLVEIGKVRAIEVDGNIAVAEEDINATSTSDLPVFISISQAIEQYHFSREDLVHLMETGKVRAVEVDGNVTVAKEDVGIALIESEAQVDKKLVGQSVRLTEAAEKYRISNVNLVRWTSAGYIRVVERGPKLLVLDESDVELVVRIFKLAKEETSSSIRAGWILKRTLEKFNSN